jgi:CTP:phosphocholine cytidylyltransferase-like protein
MDRLDAPALARMTREVIETYAGYSDQAVAYAIADEARHRYAVNAISNHPDKLSSWIIVQAHIENDYIVIDEDSVWDKNMFKALMKCGIPRQQIILAYAGETLPTP